MRLVECNKCGKVFEVEGEWGYCPFCENGQVKVPKRFEQWGYESFKDNETGEIKSDYIELLNKQNDKIEELEKKLKEQPKQIVEKIREKIVDYNIKYSSAVDVLNCLDLMLDNLLKEMKSE